MRKTLIVGLFAAATALVSQAPAHADAQSCLTATLETMSALRSENEPLASPTLATLEDGMRTFTIHNLQEGAATIIKAAQDVIAAGTYSSSTVSSAQATIGECSPMAGVIPHTQQLAGQKR